jgi:enamine deaminase RidA (YjgF/YER057c/UK114 family)
MTIERSNVAGLMEPPGYVHVASVAASRLVFIAGQVPLDGDGKMIGGSDPVEQGKQCLRNLAKCLAAVGAQPRDVVRTNVYIVADADVSLGRVWRELLETEWAEVFRTPATLVGVARLGYPGQLIEIECVAAIAV